MRGPDDRLPLYLYGPPNAGGPRRHCPTWAPQQPVCAGRHRLYVQFNYSHDISVDDIAKAVGVSRSHLYRVFMSNVGQSPIDYLTHYRISEACSLLKNSTLSIAEDPGVGRLL